MSIRPTLLFVPGAWHSEFHAKPVLPFFERLGFEVKVVLLANLGTYEGEHPKPGTQDSVERIFKLIQNEAKSGTDMVFLGHSAGGLVGAMAINKFLESATAEEKSKLRHIIFLASFIRTSKHIISHWHHLDHERGLSWVLKPEEVFYIARGRVKALLRRTSADDDFATSR